MTICRSWSTSDGPVSQMAALTRARLEAVSAAAQEYFRVNARFPDAPADLAGAWLPPEHGAAALLDGWAGPCR